MFTSINFLGFVIELYWKLLSVEKKDKGGSSPLKKFEPPLDHLSSPWLQCRI